MIGILREQRPAQKLNRQIRSEDANHKVARMAIMTTSLFH